MKKCTFLAGITIVAILMTGCGKVKAPEGASVDTQGATTVAIEETILFEENIADLYKDSWNREEPKNLQKMMQVSKYEEELFEIREDSFFRGIDMYDDSLYRLENIYETVDDVFSAIYYLKIYNTVTGELKENEYIDRNCGIIEDLYVSDGRAFGTYLSWNDGHDVSQYGVCELKNDGNIELMTNIFSVFEDEDIKEACMTRYNSYMFPESMVKYEPKSGMTYLISIDGTKMFIINATGEITGTLEELEGDKVMYSLFSEDDGGRLLWSAVGNNRVRIFYMESGEPRVVYDGKPGLETGSYHVIRDAFNKFILFNNDAVVKWDVESGELERVFVDTHASEYVSDYSKYAMRNSKGEIVVYEGNSLRVVTEKGALKQVKLTLRAEGYMGEEVKRIINNYEASHPGIEIEIMPAVEFNDMSVTLAEISQGAGPDIIMVYEESFENLYKNGAIADLTDLISPEIEAELFPFVLENATKDGKFVRFPVRAEAQVLVTDKKNLKKGTWDLEDIIDIVEDREKKGIPYETIVCGGSIGVLRTLTYNITESELVDMVNNTADFENPLFIRLLNVCKRYGGDEKYYSSEECYKLMKEGKALIWFLENGIGYYSDYKSMLPDNFIETGYPTNTKNGKKGYCYQSYVVNKNAENLDIIGDFLNSIYSMDVQPGYSTPLRRDFYDGRIVENDDRYGTGCYIKLGGNASYPIAAREDGTSYAKEYIDLLDSLTLFDYSKRANMIRNIILEESEPFMAGEKSAEETARVIQSRVSLYLLETE